MGKKISIIGAGMVGATAAYKIAKNEAVSELVLLDIKEGVAEGKALDIAQSLILRDNYNARIIGVSGNYAPTMGSDIVIITSGVPRKPGMSREELIGTNAGVIKSVIDGIMRYTKDKPIFIIVSNPIDTLAYYVAQLLQKKYGWSTFDTNRKVLGFGGMLDTARYKNYLLGYGESFRQFVHEHQGIECHVIGGHGDTTMIPLKDIKYGDGTPATSQLNTHWRGFSDIVENTKKGGATLTKMLGTSAWEAPSDGIAKTVKLITNPTNEKVEFSVYNDKEEIYIGQVVGLCDEGLDAIYLQNLTNDEEAAWNASVEAIKDVNSKLPEITT